MIHPYTLGLKLGWKDDALNEEGFTLLTRLTKIFNMKSQEREILEMSYMESLPLISQGIGSGVDELRSYVEGLEQWFPEDGGKCAQLLGRRALDVGMTKNGWKDVYAWMESIGIGTSFAMGAWMQGDEPEDIEIPSFFDEIVTILGI